MEMKLHLTFEEGMKVVEAMKKVALEYGWDTELDECGIVEEYSHVIDAALTAMGIEVRVAGEPEVEDENEYCDSAADNCFCNSDDEDEDSEEEVDDFGLPMDYWSEFDEDNGEEDNEEDDDDNTVYSLTAKGEFVLRYMQYGHSFEEACGIADILFGEGE